MCGGEGGGVFVIYSNEPICEPALSSVKHSEPISGLLRYDREAQTRYTQQCLHIILTSASVRGS